jgi:predicted secreted protein
MFATWIARKSNHAFDQPGEPEALSHSEAPPAPAPACLDARVELPQTTNLRFIIDCRNGIFTASL